jgi:hypothetical protein
MFLALSSGIAAVALIVAVLSSIQRRRLTAELAEARRTAALELSTSRDSQGPLGHDGAEGKKAAAIVAEAQAALAARDAELDTLTAEIGVARTAEAKARTKSAEETRARAAAEARAAQEIDELRRVSEDAQAEARAVSKVLVDEARQRKEVELLLDRERAKSQNAAAGEAQTADLQGQIRALEAAAATKQKELEAAAAAKQKELAAAAATKQKELAAVRKEADDARAAVAGARAAAEEAQARVKALEDERAHAAAATPAPGPPQAAEASAPAGASEGGGGGVAAAIDTDPALNRGQKETLRMMYDRFTSKTAKR